MPKKSDDWERWEKEINHSQQMVPFLLEEMADLDAIQWMNENPNFGT